MATRVSRARAPAPTGRPKVTYLIGRLHRALRKRIGDALSPLKLSVAQYTTLSVMQSRERLSNAQLASRAFITPQAMNEVIQGLEARKLVTRRPDPTHGRIVQLTLTDEGVAALRRSDAAVRNLELSMLTGLTAAERAALRKALTSCTQTLENSPPGNQAAILQ